MVPNSQVNSILQGASVCPFSISGHTFLRFQEVTNFAPLFIIECHLPAHRIPYILDYCGEPGPVGSLRARGLRAGGRHVNDSTQRAAPPSGLEAYGLEANVSLLRYLLVSLDLHLGQLRSRHIFPHDALRGVGSPLRAGSSQA